MASFLLPLLAALLGIGVLPPPSCPIEYETKIVTGNSLEGIFNDGEKVQAMFGYYACHPIQRGDIIIYDAPGKQHSFIKIIHAVPDDSFALEQTKSGDYSIRVNGRILKTSTNQPYHLTAQKSRLLAGYADYYENRIPQYSYLILGNLPGGSIDSTQFGLIKAERIIARVMRRTGTK